MKKILIILFVLLLIASIVLPAGWTWNQMDDKVGKNMEDITMVSSVEELVSDGSWVREVHDFGGRCLYPALSCPELYQQWSGNKTLSEKDVLTYIDQAEYDKVTMRPCYFYPNDEYCGYSAEKSGYQVDFAYHHNSGEGFPQPTIQMNVKMKKD